MSDTLVFLLGMSTGWSLHTIARRIGKALGKWLARRDIARAGEAVRVRAELEKP